ncbi:MAG: CDP-alcohol phosphatidyltransferase family protein [Acidobacteriota bacterium]|nr:CDP-alcohol phosphatidyltransferase family protein [Acidobacteriota bacterium]
MKFLAQFRAAPNLLTLLRLFIVPFLVIEIVDRRWRVVFALFVLAGVSDACDGLAARALNQHTRLGQYLDPIADKVMLSTLFLVLTHVGLVPHYVTTLVFSRDLGILLISMVLFATHALRDFRPSVLGKLNTLVQIVGVTVVLVGQVWRSAGVAALRGGLMWGIAVLAPLSAAHYAWVVSRRMSAEAA